MNSEVLLVIILSGIFVLSCIKCQIENCKARFHNSLFDEMQAGGSDGKTIEQQAGAPLQYDEMGQVTAAYRVPNQYPSAPQFVTVSWQ